MTCNPEGHYLQMTTSYLSVAEWIAKHKDIIDSDRPILGDTTFIAW